MSRLLRTRADAMPRKRDRHRPPVEQGQKRSNKSAGYPKSRFGDVSVKRCFGTYTDCLQIQHTWFIRRCSFTSMVFSDTQVWNSETTGFGTTRLHVWPLLVLGLPPEHSHALAAWEATMRAGGQKRPRDRMTS